MSLLLPILQCGQGFSQQENGHCAGELPAGTRGQNLAGEGQPGPWKTQVADKGGGSGEKGNVLFVSGALDAKTTAR